ncbi:MAG: hypothetical protein GY863_02190, partial [bacterium]|nr:hypothetical protein [bacterium]
MKKSKYLVFIFTFVIFAGINITAYSQKKGIKTINSQDLFTHLSFIASDELKGRNTPSDELKIAARYLASHVASYGFKPMMPDNSYFQKIPLEIKTISEAETNLVINSGAGKKVFGFPEAFGVSSSVGGNISGKVVFVGCGVSAPQLGWDDYEGVDVEGKFVVHID